MKKKICYTLCLVSLITIFIGCRDDIELIYSEQELFGRPRAVNNFKGFYLLNEGNMGSNKATLDYYDFAQGKYIRNIYGEANPTVPKEMGDVGNDVAIYGNRLYAVINLSNKVEVMNYETAERIGQIDIPNCRFIKFLGRYAYVTSYAGPVIINPHYEQIGFVAKVDTATLKVIDKCYVGFQPDELEIVGGKIYVANSGGYMGASETAGYERTVSVIDILSFQEEKRIDVAYNLERIKADKRGNLWVSSRGDYKNLPASLFYIDIAQQRVTDTIPIAATNYWIDDELLYVYGTEWSHVTQEWTVSYSLIDTRTREILTRNIITDGTDKEIEMPYGIMVDPETKDIYITDAGNYVTSGLLYCFDKNGKLRTYEDDKGKEQKMVVKTGNIPGHFALQPIYK